MNTKSRDAYKNFVPGSSRAARSRASLLAQMAREAEERAAQAERLKELRRQARVSQVTAANGIGITPRAYQAWEAGGEMSPENRKKAAVYFGTTTDYIEFGVMERRRRKTPDLSSNGHDPDLLAMIGSQVAANTDRLEKIEQALSELRELLAEAKVERAANAMAILQRLGEEEPPSEESQRRRRA